MYNKKSLWLLGLLLIIIAAAIYGVYYFHITPKNQNNYKTLDLSNQGLKSIPEYVFNQTSLEELNVSHNSLTGAIQSQIGQLKNLKV